MAIERKFAVISGGMDRSGKDDESTRVLIDVSGDKKPEVFPVKTIWEKRFFAKEEILSLILGSIVSGVKGRLTIAREVLDDKGNLLMLRLNFIPAKKDDGIVITGFDFSIAGDYGDQVVNPSMVWQRFIFSGKKERSSVIYKSDRNGNWKNGDE